MNVKSTVYHILILITGVLFFTPDGKSQDDTSVTITKTDTVSKLSPHSFYAGTGYGNNMIYLGSTISRNQPFGYAALTYSLNDELYATISGFHLSGIKPSLAFYSGSLSYSHVFNSWFDIAMSLSGYRFAPVLQDTMMSNFAYGDITLGFDWKLIYTKLSAGSLISNEKTSNFQVRNSRFFQTSRVFHQKAYFSFDPYVNLLFGTLVKSEITEITSAVGSGRWNHGKKNPVTIPSVNYSKSFGLVEIDFGLPVALNFKRFVIEAEPGYILPAYNDPEFPAPEGFLFQMNAYFRIF